MSEPSTAAKSPIRTADEVYTEAAVRENVQKLHNALNFLDSASRYGFKVQLTLNIADREAVVVDLGRLSEISPKVTVYRKVIG